MPCRSALGSPVCGTRNAHPHGSASPQAAIPGHPGPGVGLGFGGEQGPSHASAPEVAPAPACGRAPRCRDEVEAFPEHRPLLDGQVLDHAAHRPGLVHGKFGPQAPLEAVLYQQARPGPASPASADQSLQAHGEEARCSS